MSHDFRNVISRERWTSASIASLIRSFKTSEGTIIPVLGCGELARVTCRHPNLFLLLVGRPYKAYMCGGLGKGVTWVKS